jgi:5-methylcytosine-specific restriction endonuclease McrA
MQGRGWEYQKARKRLLSGSPRCVWCRERPATTADHVPPLGDFPPGMWAGELVPACMKCNSGRGAAMTNKRTGQPKHSRKW